MSFESEGITRRQVAPPAALATGDVRLQLHSGRIVGVSQDLVALLGWRPEEWISHGVEDFLHPEGLAGMDLRLSAIAPGQRLLWRDRLRSRDGGWHWVQLEVTPAPRVSADGDGDGDGDGFMTGNGPEARPGTAAGAGARQAAAAGRNGSRAAGPGGSHTDGAIAAGVAWDSVDGESIDLNAIRRDAVDVDAVARLRLLRDGDGLSGEEVQRRLRCDDLTDLLNRREVLGRIDQLQRQERRHGQWVAILFCDLDGFKTINDRFGHACGDTVLRLVAERLQGRLRASDLAARIGGDELLVVLDGVRDLSDAREVAEALRRAVAQPLELGEGRGSIVPTLSVGVTLARPGEETHQLLDRADQAMYRAKRNGRNQVMTIAS